VRARGRYLARRLHLGGIKSLAGAAIPAFGQVRQAQGIGAARRFRRCWPRGRPQASPASEICATVTGSSSSGPSPRLSPSPPPKPRVLAGPSKMARSPRQQPPAGSPGSERPSHRTPWPLRSESRGGTSLPPRRTRHRHRLGCSGRRSSRSSSSSEALLRLFAGGAVTAMSGVQGGDCSGNSGLRPVRGSAAPLPVADAAVLGPGSSSPLPQSEAAKDWDAGPAPNKAERLSSHEPTVSETAPYASPYRRTRVPPRRPAAERGHQRCARRIRRVTTRNGR
jgi:hypothetical protein